MSVEIMYEDATAELDPAVLGEGQKVMRLLNTNFAGQLIRVQIRRKDDDLTGDGIPDQINLKIEGAVVDINNAVLSTPGGRPMIAPGKVESAAISAISENQVDIVQMHAQATVDCLYRMVQLATALQIYDNIPSA